MGSGAGGVELFGDEVGVCEVDVMLVESSAVVNVMPPNV